MPTTCKLINVTPETARRLLKNNVSNRPLQKSRVSRLARAMKEGRWVLNGETIKVDTRERLLDGQHRLHACIQSDATFKSYLVTGLSPKAFDTIDQGARRSGADIFSQCGVHNAGVVSASIVQVWQHQKGIPEGSTGGHQMPDMDERVKLFDELKDFEGVVAEAMRYRQGLVGIIPITVVAGLHYLFREIDVNASLTYLKVLSTGEAPVGHPVRTVKRKFDELAHNDYRIGRQAQCAYLKLAWNHFACGAAVEEILLPKTLEIPINQISNRHWLED